MQKNKQRKLVLAAVASVLVTAVCGVALFSVAFLPDRRSTATVVIPDLVGSIYSDSLIPDAFCTLLEYDYDPAFPANCVLRQYPPAGSTRKINPSGRECRLTLTINSPGNNDLVTVPDLIGLSESEGLAILTDLGIRPGKTLYNHSSSPAGRITGQDLPSGMQISRGDELTLTVSLG